MPRINFETITDDFTLNGFFSEYLPPSFSICNDFDPCSIALSSSSDLVEPLSFTMSRFTDDGKRRTIYIPEFSSYLAAIEFIKGKQLIQDLIQLSQDSHSFSPPIQINGELTRHERVYNYGITIDEADQEAFRSKYIPNIVDKINRAKGAKGILSLDISNFYSSIYTHLIPSIKLGRENAEAMFKLQKANNADPALTDEYRTYAALDQHIRNMNAGRTNGILPGTLISQFIAEALLSRIDHEIEAHGIEFTRYVDDYEVFIFNESDIPKAQNVIASTLEKYFLTLNNEKTKYTSFPYYVVENLEKIYLNYAGTSPDKAELMKLFNTFFILEKNGTKGAIRFLIKSIDDSFVPSDNHLLSSYLLNVLVNDSRSLVKVCQLLIRRKDQIDFGASELSLIDNLLIRQIESNNHLEAIWLLYLRKKIFGKILPSKISHMIANSDNDLAKIILLEEFGSCLSNMVIQEIKRKATSWILHYQLFYNGYISKDDFSALSHITKNLAFYSALKRNHFSFYKR